MKKKEIEDNNNDKENKLINENPVKIILFSPLIILGLFKNFVDSWNENKSNEIKSSDLSLESEKKITVVNKNKKILNSENKLIQEKSETLEYNNTINNFQNNNSANIESKDYQYLENKILAKFKSKLIKLYNSAEIIESETYLIDKYADDSDLLEKSQKILKDIEILLKKVQDINYQYNLIKENNLIEDSLLLDDSILIDDIIKYREKIYKEEINIIPNKIKLLNEYNLLYTKLDKLEIKTTKLQEISDNRVQELSKRDEKYQKARNKIMNLDKINFNCNQILNKYNKYLEKLSKKVGKIDEKTFVEYKLKGLNGLFSTSLQYIGLLTLSPLRGLIPSIAARTIATRKLVNNMINNIHYDKEEKVVYSIKNYLSEINNNIYDINNIEENINCALSDVSKLKEEFHNYFFKYHLKDYELAYKKIEKIETDIINNKQKIGIIKEKMIKNKEINDIAMTKVRKLNS